MDAEPESTAPEASNPSAPPKHKRRPRYRGTHPRQFHEKYKELDPLKYPEAVQKIIASGKTPAGTHRPICVEKILELLAPQPGETAVDATLGYGGHATELLRKLLPGGRLIGLDVDPHELPRTEARLRDALNPGESLVVRHSNFAGLPRVLADLQIAGADMVLADLGCSSMQFDNPERGFSFKLAGPLDLRMNPNKGRPASVLLAALSEEKLAGIFANNSDEPHAAILARTIINARTRHPIETTTSLTHLIRDALKALPRQVREREGDDPVRRCFQALRIEVNGEFDALETFLRFLPSVLKAGGRVAILTFHSGEDRRVKHAFQEGHRAGTYASIAREVIRPTPEEIHSNPRAASAKLRWAVRA